MAAGGLGWAVVGSALMPVCSPPSSGLRGRQLLHSIAGTMVMTGGMFGFFLAVGYGLRCEPAAAPAAARRQA